MICKNCEVYEAPTKYRNCSICDLIAHGKGASLTIDGNELRYEDIVDE